MEQIKYIQFKNVAELEAKVAKLKEIRDKNLADTESFLIIAGIPFTRLEEGFGVDLQDLKDDRLEQYFRKFDTQGKSTRELYEELGVVYILKPDGLADHRIDLETRRN